MRTIGGKALSFSTSDGVGELVRFTEPRGIGITTGGDLLWIADGPTLRTLDLLTGEAITWAGLPGEPGFVDLDEDGYSACDDCDDTDPNVNPGQEETCDGVDNNCDGTVDENTENYDDDGDGQSEQNGDCDDSLSTVNPNVIEVCNNIDDNCIDGIDESSSQDAENQSCMRVR